MSWPYFHARKNVQNLLCLIPQSGKIAKYIPDINLIGSFHVECVVWMSKMKEENAEKA